MHVTHALAAARPENLTADLTIVILICVLPAVLIFAVAVAVTRWIFRINQICSHLEEIAGQLQRLNRANASAAATAAPATQSTPVTDADAERADAALRTYWSDKHQE